MEEMPPEPSPLWAHQLKALELSRGRRGYALFFEMGTGKTRCAIEILRERYNAERRVLRTLIVTPPLVVPQWKEEWGKFSKLDQSKIVLLTGPGAKRLKDFCRYAWDLHHAPQGVVFVTNYETLLMAASLEAFQEWEPEVLVFDESHKLKNHSAERSKRASLLANPWDKAKKVQKKKPFTLILSGSPVLNSPLDLFQQFKVMLGGFPTPEWLVSQDNYRLLIDNFFAFRARYFRDRNALMPRGKHFPKWEPMTQARDGRDALSEIKAIVSQVGLRVEKKDCLDLPEEISQVIKVDMTGEQTRIYKDMLKDFVAYVKGGAVVAQLAMTKAMRLQQITSGFACVEGDENTFALGFADTPKEEALKELLETITPTSKVIVWSVWRHNYPTIRRVCEALKIEYVEVHGEISDREKKENVERFNFNSSVRVFIGHPGSGGIGINLVGRPGTSDRCAYSIFYSRNFSLEHFLQARARNYRGGQTDPVTHYDLVCADTIDELVLYKLSQKIDFGESLLGDLVNELAKE